MDKHDIIAAMKRLQAELGRRPLREDLYPIGISRRCITRVFGSYSEALQAAGLEGQKVARQTKFRYKVKKLHAHTIHELNLFELFKKIKDRSLKVIAMPDTHIKHMDKKAVDCFLRFITWYQPDVFIIMGDFLDMEALSHWPSGNLEPRRIIDEVLSARRLLDRIKKAIPNCDELIYLEGNHEDWLRQYLLNSPELFDNLDVIDLHITVPKLLNVNKHGYVYIPLNEFLRIGKANFTHGIYTGDNHAKKHLMKLKCNIFYGHLHDVQETEDASIDGTIEAASLGCLCRLDAPFLKGKPNNWDHAFGVFEFNRDGDYTKIIPKIKDGYLSILGKIF